MPRTMKEKLRDWKWWGEQGLHGLAGATVSFLFWINTTWAGHTELLALFGLFAGATVGTLREILQNIDDDPADNDLVDSHVDAWAFTMGAALSSLTGLLIYG